MNIKLAIVSCLVGGFIQAMEIDDSHGTIRKWDELVAEDIDSGCISGEPFTKRSRIERDNLISPDWDGMPAEIKQIILCKLLRVQDPFKTFKQLHELRLVSSDMNDQCLDLLKTEFLAEQAQAMIEADKNKAGGLFVKSVKFDHNLMHLLIDKGVDVCFLNEKIHRRALDFASSLGYADIVDTLLGKGAHRKNESFVWALRSAIIWGHHAIAEKLLAAGALDAPLQPRLLISAIILKKFDALKVLLDQGIDPNCTDNGKYSALRYAIAGGDIATIQLLLDHKADAHAGLIFSCVMGKKDIVKLLLQYGANVNTYNESDGSDVSGKTPLMIASKFGDTELVKVLIAAKADVNLSTSSQVTPLFLASIDGFVEIVRLLLEHGAQVDTLTKDGWTALMIACHQGHLEVAQALLDAHAHIHMKGADEGTALVAACPNGHIKIVQLLLAHGADVNVVIKDNKLTPLLLAVQGGYIELVELLIAHGADIHAKTADGNTALTIAEKRADSAMVNLIKERLNN